MKQSWLVSLKEKIAAYSNKPWAVFETSGPDVTGKLGFAIAWNPAFVENLQKLGMAGQSDEETIQLFFLQLRMIPESMDPDATVETVNPEATPNLTDEANKFVRG